MTTRRDVLKIASTLGLAGTLPSSADRVAAMQLLDQKVSDKTVLDPAGFADRVDGMLAGQLEDDWLCAVNPERHAAYRRALASLQRTVTVTNTPEGFRTYGDYEGEIFNYIMASTSWPATTPAYGTARPTKTCGAQWWVSSRHAGRAGALASPRTGRCALPAVAPER